MHLNSLRYVGRASLAYEPVLGYASSLANLAIYRHPGSLAYLESISVKILKMSAAWAWSLFVINTTLTLSIVIKLMYVVQTTSPPSRMRECRIDINSIITRLANQLDRELRANTSRARSHSSGEYTHQRERKLTGNGWSTYLTGWSCLRRSVQKDPINSRITERARYALVIEALTESGMATWIGLLFYEITSLAPSSGHYTVSPFLRSCPAAPRELIAWCRPR